MTHQEILRKVPWKDLRSLSLKEMLIENNLTIPWFLTSMVLAFYGYYLLALPFSALFFLTGLRQAHNGFHNSLGTSRLLTWISLYVNSVLMMASFHAIKFNHLRHHKHCLSEEDHEGKAASMTWYGAILYGPKHMFLIHKIALQEGNKKYKKNVMLELASIGMVMLFAIGFSVDFLIYHIAVMLIGEFLMAFFAVWAVHHDTHDNPQFARTERVGWRNKLSFSMFYHLEHHLFPAVPTIKLPELADRIDATLPDMEKKKVI